jgi:hypothetical protein
MLEAIPKNIFSTRFRFQQENQLLGKIDNSIWREKALGELKDAGSVRARQRANGQEIARGRYAG